MINCTPKLGGQFELESGGQFAPKLVVNLHWNRMVNLTGFSTKSYYSYEKDLEGNRFTVLPKEVIKWNLFKLSIF